MSSFPNDCFASLESLSKFSVISFSFFANLIPFPPHQNLAFSITGYHIFSATMRAASLDARSQSLSTIFSHFSFCIQLFSNLYDFVSFFRSLKTSSDPFAGPYLAISICSFFNTSFEVILAVSLSHIWYTFFEFGPITTIFCFSHSFMNSASSERNQYHR